MSQESVAKTGTELFDEAPNNTNCLSFTCESVVKQLYALARIMDKVFTELGITYWASGGTVLGCVRHGGLIPWDDDLDICVYQEDIAKNEQLWKSLLNDNGCGIWDYPKYGYRVFLKLLDHKKDRHFRYPFCDIFMMERKQSITLIASEKDRKRWPEEYYHNEDIENMESRLFGDVNLNCAANAEEYLTRTYGEHWYTHGATREYNHAKLKDVNPDTFKLRQEHYQPAKPYK